jgi:3-oxoadipate enol-lactonase
VNRPSATKAISTVLGTLHVEVHGESGPVVFCWPSLYCDARTLDPLIEDLARDHRVLVVDPPGHGRSGASGRAFSLDEAARAAMDVLDMLGVARVTWIGPAWGGAIGTAAARRYASRLAGLVILNCPMSPWRGRKLALMRLAYSLLWLFGPRSFVSRMIADKMIAPNAGPDREALVAVLVAALRRCDRRGLLHAARSAMFLRGDVVQVLPEIRLPTVFFSGAEDALLSVDEARAEAAAVPGSRFVVVERSSHQSALEAPDQVLPVIRESIASWSSPPGTAAVSRESDHLATSA